MQLDKEEHRVLLNEIIKNSNFIGDSVEIVAELKKAINEAKIEKK